MREDDEEFRHYVPLLRRIIILVAVITAVPVVLWTITAFVRTYVGPPKIPTFHQLASTASINAPAGTATRTARPNCRRRCRLSSTESISGDSKRRARSVGRTEGIAPRRSCPGRRRQRGYPRRAADGRGISGAADGAAIRDGAARGRRFPPSPLAAPDNATPGSIGALAAAQPAAMDPAADALPASAPLSRPIPLPRHRPREAVHGAGPPT